MRKDILCARIDQRDSRGVEILPIPPYPQNFCKGSHSPPPASTITHWRDLRAERLEENGGHPPTNRGAWPPPASTFATCRTPTCRPSDRQDHQRAETRAKCVNEACRTTPLVEECRQRELMPPPPPSPQMSTQTKTVWTGRQTYSEVVSDRSLNVTMSTTS